MCIKGFGSTSGSGDNFGVYLNGSGAQVSAASGGVAITGTGGQGNHAYGLLVKGAATVSATGTGKVSLTGTGGSTSSANHNYGVYITGSGTEISAASGGISISGTGGGAGGRGTGRGRRGRHGGPPPPRELSLLPVSPTNYYTPPSTNHNYGVYLSEGTTVSTVDGALTVTGTGRCRQFWLRQLRRLRQQFDGEEYRPG